MNGRVCLSDAAAGRDDKQPDDDVDGNRFTHTDSIESEDDTDVTDEP